MINIHEWMKQYQETVQKAFGSRVLLIGLQGSYGRGEAGESSDIDVVLILDRVSLADLSAYKKAIETLPHRAQICGFVSGKEELSGWCKADLFQLYFDTVSVYGDITSIIPVPTKADACSAVLTGACGLYHACSHNFLHGGSIDALKALYKSAWFVLQAKHYCETGDFVKSHEALMRVMAGTDLAVMESARQIKAEEGTAALEGYTERLLQWTQALIGLFSQ